MVEGHWQCSCLPCFNLYHIVGQTCPTFKWLGVACPIDNTSMRHRLLGCTPYGCPCAALCVQTPLCCTMCTAYALQAIGSHSTMGCAALHWPILRSGGKMETKGRKTATAAGVMWEVAFG